MKLTSILTAGALAAVIASPVSAAETMSAEQKKEIEQIIHDYLVNNPEVLVEASQALQQKQQQSMQEQAKGAIIENAEQLFNEKLAIAGNPKGNVTLVEFFDYQCIHCKKMKPIISALIKKDANLRVIYKEFPIFGKSSELASQVALAAAMQGKYQQMHDALLDLNKRLDETIIMDAAKSVGLDLEKLKKDMESKQVMDALNANRELAEKMHLMGTPAFIIAATPGGQFKKDSEPAFIPGAASEETLQDLIKKAEG
ncbi:MULTISPECIES: DsbA family protein [Legionella]|uniref:DsbA family protein n=1 Tax=Legionella septentrionalis TaxID=2498109 RepID=A0A3S0XH04_9GAMM|nr:DsbA family protein [Legionella septentrionalis]MCP0914192.1 DsbA family protein [Legionella sp. 27cVA30]RUQ89231.1 DsbA family protein [Legionella septentrionalis]RUR00534.1 DsbA family protein [Legionella septentrionalis]RUR11735.1 DsbA family protein [Legionella septentrionalis]RUR17423.1 DsbA family protein [Legionella septentrionalis]